MQWILPFLFQQQQQQPADAAEANAMTFNNNDTLCVRVNAAGVAYEEFSCLYPSIGSSYQPYVRSFVGSVFLLCARAMRRNVNAMLFVFIRCGVYVFTQQRPH